MTDYEMISTVLAIITLVAGLLVAFINKGDK